MGDRREGGPFDPYYFERLEQSGAPLSTQDTFRLIYRQNHWGGAESVSGEGASPAQTGVLKTALPPLLEALGVTVMLDLPCGDFEWMKHIALPIDTYIGADIVPEPVADNQKKYGGKNRRFVTLDLTSDPLPDAELLLCRDGLVHLSFADIGRAFRNIRRSSVQYFLATTFPACRKNKDITTGDWRELNLERSPFCLPAPIRLINEQCSEGEGQFGDKSLGLWHVGDLPERV